MLRTRGRSRVGAGGGRSVVIPLLIGQSNNASRATAVSTTVNSVSYMPTGGACMAELDFFSGNNEHCPIHADVADIVPHTEGVNESPTAGVLSNILPVGGYANAFGFSAAIGSRSLSILGADGPRCTLYAVAHRLCDAARRRGFVPKIVYVTIHGERAMSDGDSESTYYDQGLRYYRMAQLLAAQAMGDPGYVAPVVFFHPIENKDGTDGAASRVIHKAIKRIATDLTNGINGGPAYPYPSETDRIHNTPAGFRLRGEMAGYILNQYLQGVTYTPLTMTGVTLSGTTVVATFSENITRDTNYDFGTNLNTSFGLGGFEYTDNGSYIKINSISVNANQATLTLNSAPSGTIGEQLLRIAEQTTTASLVSGSNNRSGSQIRASSGALFASIYDGSFTHYKWAIPQESAVTAA